MKSKWAFSTSVGLGLALLLQGCSQAFKVHTLPLLEMVSAPAVLTSETKPSDYSIVTSVDLGKQPIGTRASVTYYLRNSGQLPLKVKTLSISPASLAQKSRGGVPGDFDLQSPDHRHLEAGNSGELRG